FRSTNQFAGASSRPRLGPLIGSLYVNSFPASARTGVVGLNRRAHGRAASVSSRLEDSICFGPSGRDRAIAGTAPHRARGSMELALANQSASDRQRADGSEAHGRDRSQSEARL